MRTVAMESRAFVMSANQCQKRNQLPDWILHSAPTVTSSASKHHRRKSVATKENNEIALPTTTNGEIMNDSAIENDGVDNGEEYVSRGGSCIVGPLGNFVKEPVWEDAHELIIAEVDFEDCARGKLDFDAAGHYSRSDQFQFSAAGLDLNPPA